MSEQLVMRPDDTLSRMVFAVGEEIQKDKNAEIKSTQNRTVEELIFGVAKEFVTAVVKIETRTLLTNDEIRDLPTPHSSGGFSDAYAEMSIERKIREGKLTSTEYKVLLGFDFAGATDVDIFQPEVSRFAGCEVFDFDQEHTILLDIQGKRARFNREPIETAFVVDLLKEYPIG